ncbi:MAG TPA: hypothetical protein VH280_11850, partial [Verrucomicrobiae bacterium]|nr:hypothetical protein [Verrucomicrobiae bacterium]
MFSGYHIGLKAFCVCVGLTLAASTAAAEQAGRADDFADRIGINIKSPSYGNYALVYSNTALVGSKLAELGIRYYRVNAKDVDDDWAFCRSLQDTYGLKADMQVTFTFSSLSNRLRTNALALVSVEGPNETDNPAAGFTYKGLGFPTGTINFQNDLYHMVKNDPATTNLPVIVPSVAQPTNQSRLIGSLGDYENMHSYPAGNIPRTFLDSLHITNANLLFTPPKPIVSTETGYHTALQDKAPVSEKAQGKYMPRLFCDYWTRNIPRVYAYELFDEGVDQTDAEMTYGILRNDGTPKPAYTAEKNMIGLLNEPGTNFGPGDFDFSLSGSTNN